MAGHYCDHGRLPDFLVIGAAKGGTTSFHTMLGLSPDVFMSENKEPEFFSREQRWERGFGWYCALFAAARDDQLCGESSTTYTWRTRCPHAADRIAEHLPHARFFYLMRHPVKRVYSEYVYRLMRTGQVGSDRVQSFDEMTGEKPWMLDASEYLAQIERYLERFERDRFCFIIAEDMRSRLDDVMGAAWSFLGVRPGDAAALRDADEKNVASAKLEGMLKQRWSRYVDKLPVVGSIASRMPSGLRQAGYRVLRSTDRVKRQAERLAPPPLTAELAQRLLERYRPGVERLAEFLGRDLSAWLSVDGVKG